MQRFLRNLSLRTDGRTDGRRTTDACAMTVALLTKSSRAKKDPYIFTTYTTLTIIDRQIANSLRCGIYLVTLLHNVHAAELYVVQSAKRHNGSYPIEEENAPKEIFSIAPSLNKP